MKKLLLCIAMALLLCLCACGEKDPVPTYSKFPPKTTASTQATQATDPTQPTIPSQPTEPTKPTQPADPTEPDDCSRGHDFADDPDRCARCGLDYFSATLEFTLSDSREFYIVTGIGTCDRTEVIIPETYGGKPVKEIGFAAFAGANYGTGESQTRCRNITRFILPDSITEIGKAAFMNCRLLRHINLPDSITVIQDQVFSQCRALEHIQFPQGLISVGMGAFGDCWMLQEILLPDGLETIGESAFANCESAKVLGIPDTVTEIQKGAFSGCAGIEAVSIPKGVTEIKDETFAACFSLKSVEFHNRVQYIGAGAFAGCGVEVLRIPESVTVIDSGAFSSCRSLRSVLLPSGLETLGNEAFDLCVSLEGNVYNGVKYIGSEDNPYMVLLAVPGSTVKHLKVHDDTKFMVSCPQGDPEYKVSMFPAVESVYIGKSVEYMDKGLFWHAPMLTDIQVATENNTFHSRNNCIIETAGKKLTVGCKTSIIPDDGSETIVGNSAFGYVTGLVSIVIPDAVTVIEGNAFVGCADLEWILIGSGVQTIRHDILINPKSNCSVYYRGTISQWLGIELSTNLDLLSLTFYFYSEEKPTEPGKYWHYVDGVPTPWE